MTAAREPWLKPIAFAMLCFAAPEGTAPLTKDQGLPPSQALKGLSFRGVASKLAATRLGHDGGVPPRRAGGAGGGGGWGGGKGIEARGPLPFGPESGPRPCSDVSCGWGGRGRADPVRGWC